MSYATPATDEVLQATLRAVASRGIHAEVVDTRDLALQRIREIVPDGATVMTGASVTLKEIGYEDLLASHNHPWKNLKDEILSEKDLTRQRRLRRESTLADYFLGSVHAVAQTGEIVIVSASGSQLASYAFSSANVVWVVGIQKIVPTLEDGIRRAKEYVLPHEEKRQRERTNGERGTFLGRLLIFEGEPALLGRNLHLIFVKEAVGD